jgi:carbonyl reductase 1
MGRDGSFTAEEVINVNYFGVRRVNDYFGKLLLQRGRIVNIASAGGPKYVSKLSETDPLLFAKLARPWTITGGISELDEIAKTDKHLLQQGGDAYGGSKALVNALTVLQAKLNNNKDLIINSVTPGWIVTDMTKGSGASGTVEKGAVPPCWAMMDEYFIAKEPTGRYYGSDCVRSPLHVYRGPGEDPYVSDEDLVLELSQAAHDASK